KRLLIDTLSGPYDGLDGVTTVPWISRASSRNGPPAASSRKPARTPTAPVPSATPAVRSRNSRRSMTRLYASKGPYELAVTAPRRRSAVALPQREIASAAEGIPPSHHQR